MIENKPAAAETEALQGQTARRTEDYKALGALRTLTVKGGSPFN